MHLQQSSLRKSWQPGARNLFASLALILFSITSVFAVGSSATAPSDRWEALKTQLFAERSILPGDEVIEFDAPGRAFDSARVPVTIRALGKQTEQEFIRKLYLIVDKNPVPVAGTFTFEPNNGWDTIDTELRVNEYTDVRIVAEMNNGKLFMTSSFVKAAGGCSAPPSSYSRSDVTSLGSIKGGVDKFLNPKVPAVARIRLVHPNASGMQFDQSTRTYIPAHYIHTMVAEYNGKKLFTLETNFSLSQDPVLGFNFKPTEDGTLMIYAMDSKNQRFEKSWPIISTQTN